VAKTRLFKHYIINIPDTIVGKWVFHIYNIETI